MQEEYRLIGDHIHKVQGICEPSRCGSWCCKWLVFVVNPSNPDDVKYYEIHGAEARVRKDGKLAVLVYQPCNYLDEKTGKCEIYAKRPWICRRYASLEADTYKSPDCTTKLVPVSGREAQIALSKLRSG